MKKIVIEGCATCPHRDHRGAFGQIAYVPVCRRTQDRNTTLPYEVSHQRGMVVASFPKGFDHPEWCPLEDN